MKPNMTYESPLDELAYRAYCHNRQAAPHRTPQEWHDSGFFGDVLGMGMEANFQAFMARQRVRPRPTPQPPPLSPRAIGDLHTDLVAMRGHAAATETVDRMRVGRTLEDRP